jgi:hypothetical protein
MIPQLLRRELSLFVEILPHLRAITADFPPVGRLARIFDYGSKTKQYEQLKSTDRFPGRRSGRQRIRYLTGSGQRFRNAEKILEKGNDLGDSIADFSDTIKDKFNEVVDGVKGNYNKAKSSMS